MLNAACLSPFSVPCHRYHLTQELFRGQLFQAIESRSKPACVFCDSVFSSPLLFFFFFFFHNQSLTASGNGKTNPHHSAALKATNMTGSLKAERSFQFYTIHDILIVCIQILDFIRPVCRAICVDHVDQCENFGERRHAHITKARRFQLPKAATLITDCEPVARNPSMQAA